ncbi:MAG: phosphodiester glycosidase family protein [Dysgonamonadaceae bacterium]|jgi:hypothetical protein|nr:phosphodiester glycosidase family protein [Dysgonamonadaceae bacterium]
MKKAVLSLILLWFAAIVYSQTITLDGTVYNVDTLENHQVGPATQYMKLRLTTTSTKRLDAYFLVANVTDPNLTVRAALGRDSIYGGEAPTTTAKRLSTEGAFYFAGTNGDFYDTGATYAGYPVSGNMINSEIARIPGSRHVYTFDANKKSYIGMMTYAGNVHSGTESWAINSINHTRGENELKLYNQYNGKYTHTNAYGTEVAIELINGDTWGVNRTLHAKVTKIEQNVGNMAIAKGKAVLSGHGTAATNLNALSVGDEIELNLNLTMEGGITSEFAQMTGGDNYAKIVNDGVVVVTDFWNELHPRTGLGYSQTRDSVIFCVVDGRSPQSNGCTTKVLGQLMQSVGAYTAFNMDGGGSSAMYLAEQGKAVNVTSDGYERAVGNSIFVVATCPTDNVIAKIIPYTSHIEIPQYGIYELHYRGYNQYGVLLDSDLSGVVLSSPADLGTVNGNQFTCTGTQPGILTATYNGTITAQIYITPTATSGVEIRLDSVLIDNRNGYDIEVSALTAGGLQPIASQVLIWTVDNPAVCTIETGVLRALSNGSTFVVGALGEMKDTLYVTVENPSAQRMVSDVFVPNEWTISTISEWNSTVSFNTDNVPVSWEHGGAINFPYKNGRAPYVRLTKDYRLYGCPDTLKIVANIGNLQLKDVSISLRANNDTKTVAFKITAPFPANTDFDLDVPIASLFENAGIAIYPLQFNNVQFNIESSNTVGTDYFLAVKEIALIYSGVSTTGIVGLPKTSAFSVYPNPVSGGNLFVRLDNKQQQDVHIALFTLSGQLVQSQQFGKLATDVVLFPVNGIPQGIYLLKVHQGNQVETLKIIIR